MIRLKPLLALAAVLAVAGCVSLPEGEAPPDRYTLAPLAVQDSGSDLRVAVAMPEVPAGLASDRIAALHPGGRLGHLAGARWAAPLPELLRDFLATSVENRLGATAWGNHPAPYRLVTAVRDFQAEYPDGEDRPPTVRVTLVAVLWDQAAGEPVVRRRLSASRRLAEHRLGAVTAGLEGLLQRHTGTLLERVAEAAARADR